MVGVHQQTNVETATLSPNNKQQQQQQKQYDNINNNERRQRKRAKKEAARQRRLARITKNGGPPETTFLGKHKWLGGAVDPATGKIYGIPSHSHQIICITPSRTGRSSKTNQIINKEAEISTIVLPSEYQQGQFKWLRGLVHNGCLYGIPAWNTKGVLKVQLDTNEVQVLPLPRESSIYETASEAPVWREEPTSVDRGRWMWHGGAVGISSSSSSSSEQSETGEDDAKKKEVAAIYCPPSNAEYVLKVYLDGSDKVEEIGPPLSEGQNKWYGGILGVDGCVYAPPYTASGVLRINPQNDNVQVIGDFPPNNYLWHGGLLAKNTGVIYAFPAHSNEVLCIDTNVRDDEYEDGDESWRVSTIPILRHEDDTDSPDLQYKWLGGSYGGDGCIYGMPSDATTILRIDPIKNEATTFGKVSGDINKWQGGVLSSVDHCIYAVPADNSTVLRIDTDPNNDNPNNTPSLDIDYVGENFQDVDDKWQGGFVGSDDKIYAIPENCNHVMVITPDREKGPSAEMLVGSESLLYKKLH